MVVDYILDSIDWKYCERTTGPGMCTCRQCGEQYRDLCKYERRLQKLVSRHGCPSCRCRFVERMEHDGDIPGT